MTDKERILMYLFSKYFRDSLFSFESLHTKFKKCEESSLQVGDLILCTSSGYHDWTIGYLVEKGHGFSVPWVIRELDSERLCNISNDMFYKIPIEIPQSIALCGNDRKIYEKCLKATKKCDYFTRFKSIELNDGICKLNTRESFSNNIFYTVEFKYNLKTTIKSITELLIEKEKNIKKEKADVK